MEDIEGISERAATVEAAVSRAARALLGLQREDGHFIFELESITAEFILFKRSDDR